MRFQALTDYIKGRESYDYNEHGRAGNIHAAFVPDEIVASACWADDHIAKLEQLREIGVDQFAGYLQHDNKEETLRVYGETIMPALRQYVTAKTICTIAAVLKTLAQLLHRVVRPRRALSPGDATAADGLLRA